MPLTPYSISYTTRSTFIYSRNEEDHGHPTADASKSLAYIVSCGRNFQGHGDPLWSALQTNDEDGTGHSQAKSLQNTNYNQQNRRELSQGSIVDTRQPAPRAATAPSPNYETAGPEEKERHGDRAGPPPAKHFARVFREEHIVEESDQGNATQHGRR